LRRRASGETVEYPNDEIREVLHKTLGVPLFQEQAMRLAMVAAGFSPGEADQLRCAMAAWRRPAVIDEFRTRLINGMLAKGLTQQFAELVFTQIRGFGEYGFPESHAASFALLACVSAWLKCHYPAAFCVSLLNSQPMGFYAPAQLVRDAREHGVEVRSVDVNHSRWDCTLEGDAIRLGLRMIVGLPRAQALHVEQQQPFQSMDDFTSRSGVPSKIAARLAKADAFGSLKLNRRASLWRALVPIEAKGSRPLFDNLPADNEPTVELPTMDDRQEVFDDYRSIGLSLKAHPVSFFRGQLDQLDIVPAAKLAELKDGRFVRVAGLVLVRQRPGTAKGITFVTLEDETGVANLIIRMDVWERFYTVARTAPAYVASGRLQNQQGVIHVLVSRLENLSDAVNKLRSQSRDFH
jgi:error-prone DNA polymerase